MLGFTSLALLATGAFISREIGSRLSGQVQLSGTWFTSQDPEAGLVLAANGATRYQDFVRGLDFYIYTDAQGRRVASRGAQSPDKTDILMVGASYAMGWGIEYKRSMAARLSRSTGLVVTNAAVPAVGTLGAVGQVERNAGLEPRWVVYTLIDRHLERNACPCIAERAAPFCQVKAYVAFDASDRPYVHEPIDSFLAPRLGARRLFEATVKHPSLVAGAYWGLRTLLASGYRRFVQTCELDPEIELEAFDFAFEQLAQKVENLGARLVILYVPPLGEGEYEQRNPELRERLDRLTDRVDLIDLTASVRDHYTGPTPHVSLRFENDFHPNQAGHALMARGLCLGLAERGYVAQETCLE